MNFKAPEQGQFNEMLQMIVGPAAAVKPSAKADDSSISHTAIYIDDNGEVAATCACGLVTAAALGCALSMIPPGGAEGMVEDKELTGMASDNLYEVMNILSSLLMDDKTAHLKLDKVEEGGNARFTDSGGEEAYSLDLGAYGAGELIFNFS